jgi:hypothetical protein
VAHCYRYVINNLLLLTVKISSRYASTATKAKTTSRPGDSQPNYADDATVCKSIEDFVSDLSPKISGFLQNPERLSVWVPEADDKTKDFYGGLKIPNVNGRPSLLLHDLGKQPNEYADDLFRRQKHR